MSAPSCHDPYLDQVKRIVLDALGGRPATVYLFGSHATGRAHRTSDVDVAIEAHAPLPPDLLANLREALEESTVPYHVDIVDLASADEDLRARVKREGLVWNGSAND
ncbi:MAG: nucleotidyltransferase family protein [Kiloniellaceae bacterium]